MKIDSKSSNLSISSSTHDESLAGTSPTDSSGFSTPRAESSSSPMSPFLSRLSIPAVRNGQAAQPTLRKAFSSMPDFQAGTVLVALYGRYKPAANQFANFPTEFNSGKKPALTSGHAPLALTQFERAKLEAAFGREAVDESLTHDVFASVDALRRQLAYEQKSEMSAKQFYRMDPNSLPDGWVAHDTKTDYGQGLMGVSTILRGPAGECGKVASRFDGHTLYLDEIYKSSLPSKLANVPGFEHPVATMNYLTARSCKLLDVTADNLGLINVNRLQNRPPLVHVDWLQHQFPQKSVSQLIDHTTWAKKTIRQVAANIGHVPVPEPTITFQGSADWQAVHPGAVVREWRYTQAEAERLAIEHITGYPIAEVDDAHVNWKTSAAEAIKRFKTDRCAGLSPAQAAAESTKVDQIIDQCLAALEKNEAALANRYSLPPDYAPRHINFDVTFRTRPLA